MPAAEISDLIISLNANDLTTVSWNDFYSGADQYKVKVDGIVGIVTTSTSVGVLTVSPGSSRIISVEAYQNNNLVATSSIHVKIFDYVGAEQSWTVPNTVRYLFADVQGASGGDSGGLGGRSKSYISVNPGENLVFYCGGVGKNGVSVACTSVAPDYRLGGFNGGGDGGGVSDPYGCGIGQSYYTRGASGGGASDIRRIAGNLSSRIIVAGGGGGGVPGGVPGGDGGGENGVDGGYYIAGPWTSSLRGRGATISGPGLGGIWPFTDRPSFYGKDGLIGIGGTGARFAQFGDNAGRAGGGGGGYYGGGGGASGSNFGAAGGGGGGSGYIDPFSLQELVTLSSGYRTGNGRILISWFIPNIAITPNSIAGITSATYTQSFSIYDSGGNNKFILNESGNVSVSGIASDSYGNLRSIPQNSKTSSYILTASDSGKHISITTGGVTVPANVFNIGDNIVIFNNSASAQTITSSGITMYLAGTATTGNRTLAQRGIATVLCYDVNSFVIYGNELT
jgi:hypothetical protein